MLTSILPGLRELRGPLAAGIGWLAVVWLALGPERLVPSDDLNAALFERRLAVLLAGVGQPVVLAALAFAAVIIGGLVPVPSPALFRSAPAAISWLSRGGPRIEDILSEWAERATFRFSGRFTWAVLSHADSPVAVRLAATDARRRLNDPDSIDTESIPDGALRSFFLNLAQHETGALGSSLDSDDHAVMRDDWDRLKAEADLRLALVAPSLALTLVGCFTWSAWALTLLVAPVVLYRDGARHYNEALARLLGGLAYGSLQSPSVGWLDLAKLHR